MTVGFYNTYAAVAPAPGAGLLRHAGAVVEVSAEPGTGEVHALRGRGFASVQFHPESLLSPDGLDVLAGLTTGLLAPGHPATRWNWLAGESNLLGRRAP